MSVGNGNAGVVFEDLKNGLAAPLAGMGISFSSSLFGLAGSLILGFLDLQAGQAQNRFYNELEDWLAATVTDIEAEGLARGGSDGDMAAIKSAIERMAHPSDDRAPAAPRPPPWRSSPRASRGSSSTCARSSR